MNEKAKHNLGPWKPFGHEWDDPEDVERSGGRCQVTPCKWFRVIGRVKGTQTWIRPVVDGSSAEDARLRFPALENATVEEISADQFRLIVSSYPNRGRLEVGS